MNKKSAIALVTLFTLAMPMMASVQRQEMEPHQRKEMRDKFRPKAMQDEDFITVLLAESFARTYIPRYLRCSKTVNAHCILLM